MSVGDRRDRLVVSTITILALAFPILFYAWIDRFTGFALEGREILPVLQLIPLAAGEVVYRRRSAIIDRRPARPALVGAIALMAAFQGYGWWDDVSFVSGAAWKPPLGWVPWGVLASLGTLALLLFASIVGFSGFRLQLAWGARPAANSVDGHRKR
jgi:hypothetical protein